MDYLNVHLYSKIYNQNSHPNKQNLLAFPNHLNLQKNVLNSKIP